LDSTKFAACHRLAIDRHLHFPAPSMPMDPQMEKWVGKWLENEELDIH